ncbi:MAG: hypothetical protein FJ320_11515 [SAR202 cluster bacterium]|nr:hypothetical protein [SAR202 cluster bacterium]
MTKKEGFYEAAIENLPVASTGNSYEEATEELVRQFKDWAHECEEKGTLEASLEKAGYPRVDDSTEIHLMLIGEEQD